MELIPRSKRIKFYGWSNPDKNGVKNWRLYRNQEATSCYEVCCCPEKTYQYYAPMWVSKG